MSSTATATPSRARRLATALPMPKPWPSSLRALPGGAEFKEELRAVDERARTLSYSIIQSPRPIADHQATFAVRDLGGGRCEVEWSCRFRAVGVPEEEMEQTYGRIFEGGLAEL